MRSWFDIFFKRHPEPPKRTCTLQEYIKEVAGMMKARTPLEWGDEVDNAQEMYDYLVANPHVVIAEACNIQNTLKILQTRAASREKLWTHVIDKLANYGDTISSLDPEHPDVKDIEDTLETLKQVVPLTADLGQ